MRCGGRSCRSTAVAAAASGGATTAPSATAGAHGIAGTSARDDGDGHRREADREDDEAGDRRPVSEISGRGVEGRVEQDGRDEERQGELGRNGNDGRAGNEREDGAAEGEEHGIGRADAARGARQERRPRGRSRRALRARSCDLDTDDLNRYPEGRRRACAAPKRKLV